MKTTAINCTMALALAFALAASFNLDADDHRSEWAASSELQELQASQTQTVRREKAAIALCVQERGPGAVVLWTADGDLVCRARAVRVAGGGV